MINEGRGKTSGAKAHVNSYTLYAALEGPLFHGCLTVKIPTFRAKGCARNGARGTAAFAWANPPYVSSGMEKPPALGRRRLELVRIESYFGVSMVIPPPWL
jgi:hypothetical protein